MKALGTLLVALSLVAAGCGGDDASTSKADPSATEAPAAVSNGNDSATKKASATIKNFEFEPRELTVAAGGKVTWTNQDAANHTVTFKAGEGPKTIPNLRKGDKGTVTFADAGTYAYVCAYHPNMKGTILVK